MTTGKPPPTRIQIFIDGRNFYHVSRHYRFDHPVGSFINLRGLQGFIRKKVAEFLGMELEAATITRCHLFMGTDRDKKDALHEILRNRGVRLHWHALVKREDGQKKELGVDVGLATSALSAAYEDKMDVMVLLGADGDFYPAIAQVQHLKKKVVLAFWDILPSPNNKLSKRITTSNSLIRMADFIINMRVEMNAMLEGQTEEAKFIFGTKGENFTPTENQVYQDVSPVTPPETTQPRPQKPPITPAPTVHKAPEQPRAPKVADKKPVPTLNPKQHERRKRRESPKFDTTKQRGRITQKNNNVGYILPLEGKELIPFLKYDLKLTNTDFDALSAGSLVEYTVAKGARAGKDLATNICIVHE